MSSAKFAIAAAAFLGIAGLASISVAATTTTYPGIECVEANDSSPEIYYDGGKSFNNNETLNAAFKCPIPRPNSNVAGSVTDINARVDDSHPTKDVHCQAHSCNWSGGSCYHSAAIDSVGTGFQSLLLQQMSTFTNGYAYLSCDIPDAHNGALSGVLSYRATTI